jgi:hypothetical protein
MYTAGTKTISKDNNCVVQRRRDIVFTERQFAWAKGHNFNGEKCRTSRRQRERDIIYLNGKT